MSSLMAKVSQSSRCAPFKTVNFAKKPLSPVVTAGGTTGSSAGIAVVGSGFSLSAFQLS